MQLGEALTVCYRREWTLIVFYPFQVSKVMYALEGITHAYTFSTCYHQVNMIEICQYGGE